MNVDPVRPDPRYSLSFENVGRLERLAKARLLVSGKASDITSTSFDRGDEETARAIALSVFASSEIEGEGVAAEYIDSFAAAVTEPGENVGPELRQRLSTHADIVDACFRALNSEREGVLSFDFILEAHRRMFERTERAVAGRLKVREAVIHWRDRDGTVLNVPTVAAAQTEAFLHALCRRVNRLFARAREGGESSLLLVTADFVCDLLAIHPFNDGNGRLARLLCTDLLERSGYRFARLYPLDQVVPETRSDYYRVLNRSQRNWHSAEEDLSPWVNYFVEAVFAQWERAFARFRRNRPNAS